MTEATGTPEQPGALRVLPIEGGAIRLHGILHIPAEAHGIVVLARGSESSEEAAHRRALAQAQIFNDNRLASLTVDLFTTDEHELDARTGYFSANISIMQQRLIGLADWLLEQPETQKLSVGIFATGAVGAAAIRAAVERPDAILALTVAEGRLDLAQDILPRLIIPTLLIVAGNDAEAVHAHQEALKTLTVEDKRLEQVPEASNLFASDDSVKAVLRLAEEWFARKLVTIPASGSFEL